MTQSLNFIPFEKALFRLKQSLDYLENSSYSKEPELKLLFMAATIQSFEFTYEISIKFLRRYLEMTEPSSEIIDEMTFPTLIRTANERGLLKNEWSRWKIYRDKKNITSHTYDEAKACDVIQIIPEFTNEIEALLNTLKVRSTK